MKNGLLRRKIINTFCIDYDDENVITTVDRILQFIDKESKVTKRSVLSRIIACIVEIKRNIGCEDSKKVVNSVLTIIQDEFTKEELK